MKFSSILLLSLLCFQQVATDGGEEMNPEDVDDVKPPVEEEEADKKVEEVGEYSKKTTLPTLTLLTSTTNLTQNVMNSTVKTKIVEAEPVAAESEKVADKNVSAPAEKKDELLTGKEDTNPPKIDIVAEASTLAAETTAPEIGELNAKVNPEESKHENEVVVEALKEEAADKANAAPEFEAKQEVEGGKGEEDPDANVDKPAQVDPPKDEADGAAKEDRETPAIGAEGLHEAVEEARGNPAPAAPVVETKKDSADEEQTLDTAPIVRPHRLNVENGFDSKYEKYSRENDGSTGFMPFFFIATFLVIFIYVLQHNKKRILGLMFEGRSSGSRRGGNVKYRRLSQNESS